MLTLWVSFNWLTCFNLRLVTVSGLSCHNLMKYIDQGQSHQQNTLWGSWPLSGQGSLQSLTTVTLLVALGPVLKASGVPQHVTGSQLPSLDVQQLIHLSRHFPTELKASPLPSSLCWHLPATLSVSLSFCESSVPLLSNPDHFPESRLSCSHQHWSNSRYTGCARVHFTQASYISLN